MVAKPAGLRTVTYDAAGARRAYCSLRQDLQLVLVVVGLGPGFKLLVTGTVTVTVLLRLLLRVRP